LGHWAQRENDQMAPSVWWRKRKKEKLRSIAQGAHLNVQPGVAGDQEFDGRHRLDKRG